MAKSLMINARVDSNGTEILTTYPAAQTRYLVLANSGMSAETTEAHTQITHRTDGVFSNLYIRVTSNVTDGNVTLRTRKNAGNGNQVCVISGATTGEFEDTTNTDTVTGSATDEWNYSVVVDGAGEIDGAGQSFRFSLISSLFAATTDTVCRYAAVSFPDLSDGTTFYYAIAGLADSGLATTEAWARFDTNAAATYNNFFIYVSANATAAGSASAYVRKNGADTNLFCAITALTTGIFEDTASPESFSANDDINYSLQSVNGLAMTMEIMSIEATSTNQTFHSVHGRTASGMGAQGFNQTGYYPVGGGSTSRTTTVDNAKTDINIAATLSNLTIYVSSNTITA